MEVSTQTRIQKKRAKMAAKKLAKETGIPLPKASKIPKTKKKTTLAPKPKTELKPAPNSPSKINNHAELYRLMQEEKNPILGPNDIDYIEKPAHELEFFVSSNPKYYGLELDFPDETVAFLDPKKHCSELHKMLTDISYRIVLAKLSRDGRDSLRAFIFEADKNPMFRYYNQDELPNIMEYRSVRSSDVTLILDIVPTANNTAKLYLTNIDGIRISAGSYEFDESMINLDLSEFSFRLAKDIEYTMRCALKNAADEKLYKLSLEYFEGDIIAMFLPARIAR